MVLRSILGENLGAVLHLGDVVLVDVDEVFEHGAFRAWHMRLDIDRIHVGVFVEREGKPPDEFRAVPEGEIVPECFLPEIDAHRFLPVVPTLLSTQFRTQIAGSALG